MWVSQGSCSMHISGHEAIVRAIANRSVKLSPNEKLGVKKVGIPLSGQLVVHQTTLSRVYVYRGWVTRLLVFSMYKRFTTHSLNSDASLCKRHQRGVATSSFVTPVHDELSFLSSSIIKKKKKKWKLSTCQTIIRRMYV